MFHHKYANILMNLKTNHKLVAFSQGLLKSLAIQVLPRI